MTDETNNIWYPGASWIVKVFRFLNLLDDEHNVLSPTKFNVWAATLSTVCASLASLFAWIGNHMTGIETVWAGTIGWMTHAYIAHHNDKKLRRQLPLK